MLLNSSHEPHPRFSHDSPDAHNLHHFQPLTSCSNDSHSRRATRCASPATLTARATAAAPSCAAAASPTSLFFQASQLSDIWLHTAYFIPINNIYGFKLRHQRSLEYVAQQTYLSMLLNCRTGMSHSTTHLGNEFVRDPQRSLKRCCLQTRDLRALQLACRQP